MRSRGPSPPTWYAMFRSPLFAYRVSGRVDGIEPPLAGHALQLPRTAVLKLDLGSVTRKLHPHELVVSLQQAAPVAVAELGGTLGRIHEIGEEDGRQHRVRNPSRGASLEERLDRFDGELVLLDR